MQTSVYNDMVLLQFKPNLTQDLKADFAYKVKRYSHFHIPTFFSEYGNNANRPRDFGETAAMLSSPAMTKVFSGGFAYEFWEGHNL